jgi:two-component system cell cycle sensor histidine kinase/response regulator CckA
LIFLKGSSSPHRAARCRICRDQEAAMMAPPKPASVILVVDDEQVIRNLLRVSLQRHGYGVLEASNGAEALTLFDEHHREIALLLTDVAMPEIGGVELARSVVRKRPELPVVFISAFTETIPNDLRCHGCIPKPFLPTQVIERVAEIVPKPILD